MPASPADSGSAALERALANAATAPDRIDEVLAELRTGRVWIPLPDVPDVPDAPLAWRDGLAGAIRSDGAVRLPTVVYQGAEFVPAFTSPDRLRAWARWDLDTDAEIPHLVVDATALARLLPARLGIAVNPNAGPSVALSPAGVSDLARSDVEAHRA